MLWEEFINSDNVTEIDYKILYDGRNISSIYGIF